MEKEIYIGDTDTFAIRYVPGWSIKDTKHYYAYCHLVLGGQIIGDPEESCYLGSWVHQLKMTQERIKDKTYAITHPAFHNKSDEDLFELIWKSNQLEENYKPAFSHLPVLENDVWVNCSLSIDETTDAYLITMTGENDKIKFLWEGWRDPCPQDKIGKLFGVKVSRDFVVDVLEKCLDLVEKEYRDYPER